MVVMMMMTTMHLHVSWQAWQPGRLPPVLPQGWSISLLGMTCHGKMVVGGRGEEKRNGGPTVAESYLGLRKGYSP